MISRKGEVNIVATMLIFGLMISSLAVLYSQISPTLLGYEARTQSANQEYIMQTIAANVEELRTSAEGAQRRVHIFSERTVYDINRGSVVTINVLDNGVQVGTAAENIGKLNANIQGSFQPSFGPSYLNRVFNEQTFINNMSMPNTVSFVSIAEFTRSEGNFTIYFRPWLSVIETSPGVWTMTIVFIQIEYLQVSGIDTSPLDFPIEQDEWTLRLKRKTSIIEPDVVVNPVTGPITITHTAGSISGTPFSFPSINNGDSLTIRYITIPILFSI